nr:immunoglobulin light chain junction region [Macaca mulatta]MOW28040.1 immunoglobulin light chain junction region [Macaca mulatta]
EYYCWLHYSGAVLF